MRFVRQLRLPGIRRLRRRVRLHSSGGGNVLRGCRAYDNSDDGFDFINAAGSCKVEDPFSFRNGWVPPASTHGTPGAAAGNGAGFKAGGYGSPPEVPSTGAATHTVQRCVAVGNRSQGFYANHHPGRINFYNNTAYNRTTGVGGGGVSSSTRQTGGSLGGSVVASGGGIGGVSTMASSEGGSGGLPRTSDSSTGGTAGGNTVTVSTTGGTAGSPTTSAKHGGGCNMAGRSGGGRAGWLVFLLFAVVGRIHLSRDHARSACVSFSRLWLARSPTTSTETPVRAHLRPHSQR